jgi:hypothetical protein
VVVLNQTSFYRNDLSIEENSHRANHLVPQIVLLGGDDYYDGNGKTRQANLITTSLVPIVT